MSLNLIIISGRLGQDAKTETAKNGTTKITRFSVATSRAAKKADGTWENITVWHNVVAFNLSEAKVNKLIKGAMVEVQGEQVNGSYVNKDGQKVNTSEISAAKVECYAIDKSGSKGEGSAKSGDVYSPKEDEDDDLPF